jgi:NAD(P)-dependent dehydrogenase (short-subunit alcohol dehydrogenase family)
MQTWDKVIAANLNGQWDITIALLPELQHAGASVICVASIAAFTVPGSSAAFVRGVTIPLDVGFLSL